MFAALCSVGAAVISADRRRDAPLLLPKLDYVITSDPLVLIEDIRLFLIGQRLVSCFSSKVRIKILAGVGDAD